MPRSVFLGRELSQRTTYRYEAGLLVESVTVHEAAWTDEDQAWLLALLQEENERCGGCGQLLADCMDRETGGTWEVKRHFCQACIVLEAEQDNEREKPGSQRQRGLKFSVRRTE